LSDERRETFGAALEQSEQLFAAAGAVGCEARALPLFYASSQAGRAITAMSSKDDWKSSSHGIMAKQLDGSVWDVQLQNQKKGLFISVADEIRSSGLVGAVRLGHVLASIPEVSSTVPRAASVTPALLRRRQRSRGQEFWGGPEVDSTGISVGWSIPGLRPIGIRPRGQPEDHSHIAGTAGRGCIICNQIHRRVSRVAISPIENGRLDAR